MISARLYYVLSRHSVCYTCTDHDTLICAYYVRSRFAPVMWYPLNARFRPCSGPPRLYRTAAFYMLVILLAKSGSVEV